jgi:hypothetical protein
MYQIVGFYMIEKERKNYGKIFSKIFYSIVMIGLSISILGLTLSVISTNILFIIASSTLTVFFVYSLEEVDVEEYLANKNR